jgi:hypothetical protein
MRGRMSTIPVNVDNFARAETHRMFGDLLRAAGGVSQWSHNRVPTPVEQQTVIRMNRDTLYSWAIVDLSEGATVTIPDPGDRYLSVMVVNEDHYVNAVLHEPGEHRLAAEDFDTRYVALAARTLVDPRDPGDLDAVAALQDGLGVVSAAGIPPSFPEYDPASLDATRSALLELARGLTHFDHAFGRREEVNPVRHLIATAAGWGGLPESEARYAGVEPGLPVGEYRLVVKDVPVDGFWSISVYNAGGFFEPNDLDAYSVNDITAERGEDGSVTVNFGGCGEGRPNCLPIVEGWNYIVRMYRPRPEILDGSWQFPSIEAG